MTREEAKDMFRKDKDAYGKPRGVMGKLDKIYDEFEKEIKEVHGDLNLDILILKAKIKELTEA